ncbi:hypothetical protein ABZ896_21355 [Streptomyces sp. NPDC047072]|uniref:hypothetical protein n=1 Tax=Streptomyces sp. NPDC047072 TaxID=3154809 RepID=UPI0033F2605E
MSGVVPRLGAAAVVGAGGGGLAIAERGWGARLFGIAECGWGAWLSATEARAS